MSFAIFLLCVCCALLGLGVGWACAFFYWPPGLYARASIWFAKRAQRSETMQHTDGYR